MLKDKMKTYNFWISLVSAVLLVARLIAGKFNVEIDSSLVMDVTTGLCGIFVVLGIISAPQKTVTKFIDRPLDGIIAQPLTQNQETKSDNEAPTADDCIKESLGLAANSESASTSHCEERSDTATPLLEDSAPDCHCEERSDVAIPSLGDEVAIPSLENNARNCHCEERSDVAIPSLGDEVIIPSLPNLAEFSKEQLIEIICANPQVLDVAKNNN